MSEKPTRRDVVLAAATLAPAAVASAVLAGCEPGDKPSASAATASPRPAREVSKVVDAMRTSDGAGVRLSRSLGSPQLAMLDPFLMLDEFRSDDPNDYIAGFPDHPHRGFETVTYMLAGAMEHRDSIGNRGHLGPGSVQWMTAGSGIIHSEMPKQENGLMWGFQLWVNLPARSKMMKPRYQDLQADKVPEVTVGSATVRIVAGTVAGVTGPVEGIVTAPTMLDVKLAAGGSFDHELPVEHAAFVYVFEGAVKVGPQRRAIARGQLATLSRGETVHAESEGGGRFLLLAGAPIGEPVARYGPFVMNTEDELRQAFADYRSGRLVRG